MSSPIAIDLFCGCGGLSLGLRQAGFRVIGAVDIDHLAAKAYRLNHPDTHLWERDIRRLTIAKVRRQLGIRPGQLDLLAGCPPCQGFSSMRTHNKGQAVTDDRNDLVLEFIRFVRGLRPRAVMLENVPGLEGDERLEELLKELHRRGYVARREVLDAADYGVPQRRRRLIMLAGWRAAIAPGEPAPTRKSVREAFAVLPARGNGDDWLHDLPERRTPRIADMIKRIPEDGGSRADLGPEAQLACHRNLDGFHDVYGRMAWSDVAPTITGGCINPSKGRFLHPKEHRSITLREAAVLQGFPVDYRFPEDGGKFAIASLIGNALPPEFIRRHAEAVRIHLDSQPRRCRVAWTAQAV